jgi:hypothetical protein
MILFTLIITVGFAYELGSGALQIDSRQYSTNLSQNPGFNSANSSYIFKSQTISLSFIGRVSLRRRISLRRHVNICRSVSSTTHLSTRNSLDFLRKVNSSDFSSKNYIISPTNPNFYLTSEQFNILRTLQPINFKSSQKRYYSTQGSDVTCINP